MQIYNLSKLGVDVDSDDEHIEPGAFRRTQNLHRDPLGSDESVVSRPGLIAFTTSDTAGAVLGGIGVPLDNRKVGSGLLVFYILRGGAQA